MIIQIYSISRSKRKHTNEHVMYNSTRHVMFVYILTKDTFLFFRSLHSDKKVSCDIRLFSARNLNCIWEKHTYEKIPANGLFSHSLVSRCWSNPSSQIYYYQPSNFPRKYLNAFSSSGFVKMSAICWVVSIDSILIDLLLTYCLK